MGVSILIHTARAGRKSRAAAVRDRRERQVPRGVEVGQRHPAEHAVWDWGRGQDGHRSSEQCHAHSRGGRAVGLAG